MQFQFSASVLAKVNVSSARVFDETYTEDDIRRWCEEQRIVEDGRDLSESALKKYGERMFLEKLQSDIDRGPSYLLDRIEDDIREEMREHGGPVISIEQDTIKCKPLHRVSPGQLSIA